MSARVSSCLFFKERLNYLVLEASEQIAGSWPNYYESLTLFSPSAYSSLPEYPLYGDPKHYPSKAEIITYLNDYANHFSFNIFTNEKVL